MNICKFQFIDVAAIFFALMFSGCASTTNLRNSFTGYAGQSRAFQTALASGDGDRIDKEINSLKAECESSDKILYLQERGRMRSLNGDTDGSIADYQAAGDIFENVRMKAVVSASDTWFGVTALASNDLAIPYAGCGYEKVMLHNFQAENYLLKDNYDFARIELNRADVEQAFSLQQHEELERKAKEKERKFQIDAGSAVADLHERTAEAIPQGEGTVKNSFQNAFTFYLRGTLYEDSGDAARALIEYKTAREIFPNNHFVAEAAMRMAGICGDHSEQKVLRDHYGNALTGALCPAGSGRLVVVLESGFLRSRSTFRLPFVLDGDRILELVLPFYDAGGYRRPEGLEISDSNAVRIGAHTQTLCNLDAMAVRNLDEQYGPLLIRQILRMVARYKMQQQAGNGAAGFLVRVANVMTDRADDRGWLTLPQSIQIAELFLPAGEHNLNCSGFDVSKNVTLEIKPGQTHYLFITQLGQQLFFRSRDLVTGGSVP